MKPFSFEAAFDPAASVDTPDVLVDVSRRPLDRVEAVPGGGLRIGAAVRTTELAGHPDVRRAQPALARALIGPAGPGRTADTVAETLVQQSSCAPCEQQHAPCEHVSEVAQALTALDAVAVVLSSRGERRTPVDAVLAGALEPGDLVVSVEVPPRPAGPSRIPAARDGSRDTAALSRAGSRRH